MHENMKTSMWHTGRSERTWRLPACIVLYCSFGVGLRTPNLGEWQAVGVGDGTVPKERL